MQRQLRLGDILDDYCPRERRLTNHAIVAMIGADVKQTRCMTCDADHEYKHAKIPRLRRKDSPAALQAQILAGGPKRVLPEPIARPESLAGGTPAPAHTDVDEVPAAASRFRPQAPSSASRPPDLGEDLGEDDDRSEREGGSRGDDEATEVAEPRAGARAAGDHEGPAHRRLIRATLPRIEGQPPTVRPAPEFTIRTPATGRPNRFRPRQQRSGGQPVAGNRPGPTGSHSRGGPQRHGNVRSPQTPHQTRRLDGRKRSK